MSFHDFADIIIFRFRFRLIFKDENSSKLLTLKIGLDCFGDVSVSVP